MLGAFSHSFYAMGTVVAILVLSTCIRLTLKVKNPTKDYTELRQRIQSWWVMVAILFGVLIVKGNCALVFFGFLSFLILKEFLSIVPIRQADRRVVFWLYLAIPLQYYWVSSAWYGMFIIFIPVYVFLFIPVRMVLIGATDGFIKSAGILNWAVMLSVFSVSHIAYLLVLPEKNTAAGGVGLVLYLLFTTQFNDVCQYTWGKMFGKHKIIPKVSPNKTWEGFIGGVSTITIVSGFSAPFLTPLNMLEGFIAGFIIGTGGFFGDLVISSVKRDLKIKDTGNFIPGHGGLLDRMDSLLYTSPIFFHYLYYLHY